LLKLCELLKYFQRSDANSESALWNAMMAPLSKTAVRGAIWYQGESNVGWNANYYSCHMAAMAQDWKQTFVDGDVQADNGIAFPFGIVQVRYILWKCLCSKIT
jgi:sialate O-acetylesterase